MKIRLASLLCLVNYSNVQKIGQYRSCDISYGDRSFIIMVRYKLFIFLPSALLAFTASFLSSRFFSISSCCSLLIKVHLSSSFNQHIIQVISVPTASMCCILWIPDYLYLSQNMFYNNTVYKTVQLVRFLKPVIRLAFFHTLVLLMLQSILCHVIMI